jgi:PAS domain S-box-containing protein
MNESIEKFQLLLEANRILSSTLHLPALLRRVMQFATAVVEAETSSLLLYDAVRGELSFDLALSEKESQLKEIRLKLGEGVAGIAAREKKTLVVNDAMHDPRHAQGTDARTDFVTRSVVAVPLLYRGELRGVIEAVNKKLGDFTAADAGILEAFAAQAAIALENARIFESLNEEKEKIQTIFSQMSDSAIFVDTAGKKLLANAAAEKLLGVENGAKETIQGMLVDFCSPEHIDALLASANDEVAVELSRREGKTLHLGGRMTRIRDTGGDAIGCIFIFRDVTQEREARLLQRNFLSLISHKLKTPLVAITGYGPLLLESDAPLTDFQRKAITSMQKQGNYLSSLVDKLLCFTAIGMEQLTLTKEQCDLASIVDRVLSSLKPYFRERVPSVTVADEVRSLPPVLMDREKVEIALNNMVENAVKFNTSADKTVLIGGRQENGFVGITVTDNGPGIPPEERENIFRQFYQIEESFTGQVAGAGLGLALAKRIADAHGGRIAVENAPGRGSTFYFMLPAEKQ